MRWSSHNIGWDVLVSQVVAWACLSSQNVSQVVRMAHGEDVASTLPETSPGKEPG